MTNWPMPKLREVCEGLYDGPHATPPPATVGPIFLGINNVTEEGRMDLSTIRHIAPSEFPRWTKRVAPRAGDLVFSYEASLHRYAIVPDGFVGCLGRRMALLRPIPAKLNVRFLLYYLLSPEWRKTVSRVMLSGATVDRIPLSKVLDLPIRLPRMDVQSRLASVLGAFDDLIAANERRICALEETARGLYGGWFSNTQATSDLITEREDWPLVRASEAIDVNPRVALSKEGEKPFVPMAALAEGGMLINYVESRSGNNGAKFQNGDTLLARITPCLENGKTAFVQFLSDNDARAFGSTEFIVLRSRTLTPEFVYCLARSADFRGAAIKSMSGATGRQRVQEQFLDDYVLRHPSQDLLDQFTKVVRPMFRMIQTLHLQIQNLRETRDLLLPRLMSGQLQLKTD